jgi:hypothetical protein
LEQFALGFAADSRDERQSQPVAERLGRKHRSGRAYEVIDFHGAFRLHHQRVRYAVERAEDENQTDSFGRDLDTRLLVVFIALGNNPVSFECEDVANLKAILATEIQRDD